MWFEWAAPWKFHETGPTPYRIPGGYFTNQADNTWKLKRQVLFFKTAKNDKLQEEFMLYKDFLFFYFEFPKNPLWNGAKF